MRKLFFVLVLALAFSRAAEADCTTVAGPDPFTGTNGNSIETYSANWLSLNVLDAEMQINTNAIRSSGSDAQAMWQGAGSFNDDQCAKITLVGAYSNGSDNDRIGVVLRADGNTGNSRNMYYVIYHVASQTVIFYEVTAGTQNAICTPLSSTFAANDVLRVDIIADEMTVYKNDVSVGTCTDASITTGKPGVAGRQSAGDLKGDDWIGGNVTFGGGGVTDVLTMQQISKGYGPHRSQQLGGLLQ